MEAKKVLLFGIGFFQRNLLKRISQTRNCIVVDNDSVLLDRFTGFVDGLEVIHGDASSIITWRKIDMENISHIVSSVQDQEVITEICRIIREVYKLEIPIIILWYQGDYISNFEKYDVKLINPLEIGIEAVMGMIEKNMVRPSNIGLGIGEIVEVTILRRSHLVDRKMRYLQPNRWRVAAAYREGKLIIPDGEFKLQVGDRAILIGEPKVIDNIVNILMIGTPEFPIQYGQIFGVLADKLRTEDIREIVKFSDMIKARKFESYNIEKNSDIYDDAVEALSKEGCVEGSKLKNFRSSLYLKDIGILALSAPEHFGIFNIRMRYFFKNASSPILMTRGSFPYSEIVVSLNGKIPDRLIDISSEISTLLGIPFSIVYVAPPGALKNNSDEEKIRVRQSLVTDYENLNRKKVRYTFLEGNPVIETLNIINGKKDILLIVAADSSEPISFLIPHTSYLLAGRSGVSVLVLPDEDTNE